MPFHTWLPAAYTEAPTGTTMLLTGAMSKMGVYGFLRILAADLRRRRCTPSHAAARARRRHHRPRRLRGPRAERPEAHLRLLLDQPPRLLPARHLRHRSSPPAPIPTLHRQKSAALNGVILQMFNHGTHRRRALLVHRHARTAQRRPPRPRRLRRPAQASLPCSPASWASRSSRRSGLPGLNGFVGEFLIFNGVFPLVAWRHLRLRRSACCSPQSSFSPSSSESSPARSTERWASIPRPHYAASVSRSRPPSH